MSATQKWRKCLEATKKGSGLSGNIQDPIETTETSLLMTNNETSETEDGKQVENQNNVELSGRGKGASKTSRRKFECYWRERGLTSEKPF